jgi:hypothetical protein
MDPRPPTVEIITEGEVNEVALTPMTVETSWSLVIKGAPPIKIEETPMDPLMLRVYPPGPPGWSLLIPTELFVLSTNRVLLKTRVLAVAIIWLLDVKVVGWDCV